MTEQHQRDFEQQAKLNPMTTPNAKPRAGEHTKGPWKAITDTVHTIAGAQIADCSFAVKAEANARRIVACVNALEGVSLEAIENGGRHASVVQALGIERDRAKLLLEATQRQYIEAKAERDALAAQNRELVEALEELVIRCNGAEGVRADGSNIQTMRASAILANHGR